MAWLETFGSQLNAGALVALGYGLRSVKESVKQILQRLNRIENIFFTESQKNIRVDK
jgi:hypothetical protein